MELKGYRENIEQLNEKFPGRVAISIKECSEVLNCNVKTVYESIKPYRKNPIPTLLIGSRKRLIPITGLARWMCLR